MKKINIKRIKGEWILHSSTKERKVIEALIEVVNKLNSNQYD
jgi:hypothetical protein